MFDFVRTHQKAAQIIILLFIVPGFVAVSISSYTDDKVKEGEIASLGSEKLTEQKFMQMIENNKEAIIQSYGADFMKNKSLINQFKIEAVNSLAGEVWLKEHGIVGSEKAAIAELSKILTNPELELIDAKGVVDPVKYEQHLNKINQTEDKLITAVKKDLLDKQQQTLLQSINWIPKTSMRILEDKMSLERQIRTKSFTVNAAILIPKTRELETWYQNHKQAFLTTEQVDIRFIELKKEGILIPETIANISENQIKEKYNTLLKNKDESIVKNEERSVRHILITTSKETTTSADKAAKEKITAILSKITQAKNDPILFKKLAKEISQDPGSKDNGGDLGIINKGQMVPIFEKTAYELTQKNQVSSVIKSDFGYHIIQLSDLKPAKITSFEQVKTSLKEQLTQEITASAIDKAFATKLEEFQTSLEDQGDITFTAKKLNLPVQKFEKLTKMNASLINPLLGNSKVLDAIFSKEGQQKQASQAIEVEGGKWVSIQVEKFYPKIQPALKTVYETVLKQWQQEKAGMMAQQQALAWFKKYQAQPQKALPEFIATSADWINLLDDDKIQSLGLTQKGLTTLMSAKLPSLVMLDSDVTLNPVKNSYRVHYVDAQRKASFDDTQKQELTQKLQRLNSVTAGAYGFMPIHYMKKELKVRINF